MPNPLEIVSDMGTRINVLTAKCIVCRQSTMMNISKGAYDRWQYDTHIQDAFPELSASEREMLMTGTHDACFESIFAEPKDEHCPTCGASILEDQPGFCEACMSNVETESLPEMTIMENGL